MIYSDGNEMNYVKLKTHCIFQTMQSGESFRTTI